MEVLVSKPYVLGAEAEAGAETKAEAESTIRQLQEEVTRVCRG